MLTLKNITLRRGENVLLQDMGVSLLPGCLSILRGGNGAGKTTLLKSIAGLVRYQGRMEWAGEAVADVPEFSDSLLYLGHENAIKLELSVWENIVFWANLHGTPELVPAALRYFDLEDRAETPCGLLSAGWRRRVALARFLAVPAQIWLMDEPFAHLDDATEKRVWGMMMSRLNQDGIIIIAHHGPVQLAPHQILDLPDWGPHV